MSPRSDAAASDVKTPPCAAGLGAIVPAKSGLTCVIDRDIGEVFLATGPVVGVFDIVRAGGAEKIVWSPP